jgi:hypothetical protein
VFGSLNEDDAKYYNEQIKLSEKNLDDMNTLLQQQLSIVKSSLRAVNHTFADVEYNDSLLKEGIDRVTKYMNTLKSETNEKMNLFSAKIEIDGHILRANNAMNTLQCDIDFLIDSVINAQKEVLQPQVISPVTWLETLNKECLRYPKRYCSTFHFVQGLSTHITEVM